MAHSGAACPEPHHLSGILGFCSEAKGEPGSFLASFSSNITVLEGKSKSAFSGSQGYPSCAFNFPYLPDQMCSEMMLVDEWWRHLECASSLGLEVISPGAFPACVTDPGLVSSGGTGRGWLVGTGVTDTPCCATPGGTEGNGLMEWRGVLD